MCPNRCDPIDCSQPGFSVCGDSPGKNTGAGCHFLFQGIFPTQRSNLYLLHCRQILWLLSYQETSFRGLHLWRGFILSSLFKRAQGLSPAQHRHGNSSHHPLGFVFWNFLLAPLPYPHPQQPESTWNLPVLCLTSLLVSDPRLFVSFYQTHIYSSVQFCHYFLNLYFIEI